MSLYIQLKHNERTGQDNIVLNSSITVAKMWQEASGLWSISAGIGAHKNVVSALSHDVAKSVCVTLLCSFGMEATTTKGGRSVVFKRHQ
jgi:hypothetical protein